MTVVAGYRSGKVGLSGLHLAVRLARTLETSLSELVVRGTIALDAARLVANRPAEVRDLERVAG